MKMLFGHQASGPAGLLKVQGSATSLAAEDHPDGAGRRWRGRGHGYGQRDAGTRASRSQATALPSAARASLRLHLCHRSRRGGLGAPAHRVRGASAARAAGARSTRDLRRGADHPAPVSDARRLDFSIGARRLPRIAAHATSPLYFPQLAPRQEAGPAHPSCTLSHYPLISLPDSNNSTHSPSPFPCLPRRLSADGGARDAPCESPRSPPRGRFPTLGGAVDSCCARITRMRFVMLRGMHVVPSRARAAASVLSKVRAACRSVRAAVGACCCTFVRWCMILHQFPM